MDPYWTLFAFQHQWIFWLIILLAVESVLKAVGLWKAGKNNQLYWFIAIFIFNTLGVLPLIYLLFFQKPQRSKK